MFYNLLFIYWAVFPTGAFWIFNIKISELRFAVWSVKKNTTTTTTTTTTNNNNNNNNNNGLEQSAGEWK